MSKEQLKQLLKENLAVEVTVKEPVLGSPYLETRVSFEGETISISEEYLPGWSYDN